MPNCYYITHDFPVSNFWNIMLSFFHLCIYSDGEWDDGLKQKGTGKLDHSQCAMKPRTV